MKLKKYYIYFISAVIYGLFNSISNYFNLPGCEFVELRFQIVLPMFIGFIYGPIPGFFVGFIGDRLGYALHGLNIMFAWNWSIANGFIGMIPGLAIFLKLKNIKSIRDYTIIMILSASAASFPIVFASILDTIILKLSFFNILYTRIIPASITNIVFALLLFPLLLILAKRLFFTIATRNMLLITYLLLLSVILTYSVSVWTMWSNATAENILNYQDLYNIGILSFSILIVGFGISVLIVKKVTTPIITIANTAENIANGNYILNQEFENVVLRPDELGKLATVFKNMTSQIYKREKKLKNEVRELKIILEKNKNIEAVKKITGTKYFQKLKEKAKEMRNKNEE
jgi:energy-coupling factor transport system substrate-specific component